MDDATRAAIQRIVDRDSTTAVQALAAAERAVDEGRLNIAKVLRAVALSSRTRALDLSRVAAPDALTALGGIHAAESASNAGLRALLADASSADRASMEEALRASASTTDLLGRTLESLSSNRDVPESIVAQFLWGCEECGLIIERDRPDVCPSCGMIAGDFTLFAPFFSDTAEHVGRKTPDEVVAMLREDAGKLNVAIVGVDDARLTPRPGEGEWCAKEIAGHMVDIAELFCRRIRPAVEPDTSSPAERVLMPWKLIDGQDYPSETADAIAARFSTAMSEALRLVGRIEGRAWSEKAEFTRSRVRLIDMASWLANHNVAHLEQLRARLA